jgi:hypothetical protein
VEEGVQHNPTTQLTWIPAASTGDNKLEAGRRIKLTKGGDLMKYYPLDEEAQAEFQQCKLSHN